MKVTLIPEQEILAALVGYRRRENALKRSLRPRHANGSQWAGTCEGACAELAVAVALNLPWTGEHALGLPPYPVDVGENTEVRWVAAGKPAYLYLDVRRDPADRIYVLVQGHAPNFEILGYIAGSDARRDEYLTTYPERVVYRIPAADLHPLT